jgi:hypothetical protein
MADDATASGPWAVVDPRRRYPSSPLVDHESEAVLVEAVHDLILLRSPMWGEDTGATLHALASLAAQIQAWLPDAVADARDQDYRWDEIAQLLGIPAGTARRRFNHHAVTREAPIEPD